MRDRLCPAVLFLLLALGVGGCGASSSSHSASSASDTHTGGTQTGTSSTAPTIAGSPTHTTAPSRRRSSTTTTRSTSTTRSASSAHNVSTTRTTSTTAAPAPATVRTAPPPTPMGTPRAPDGLTHTTGYGTYELCAGGCSGSVPSALRRSLALPHGGSGASCPVSRGRGAVKPVGSAQITITPFLGSSWRGARVTWASSSGYTGPVLIRGRQLGGPGAVGFGEGHAPYDELQLLAAGMGAPRGPGGGREWLSFIRVRSPGCYAYQIDGTSFSSVAVLRAR